LESDDKTDGKMLNKALGIIGYHLTRRDEIELYRSLSPSALLYSELDNESRSLVAPFLPFSRAQLAQDLFALAWSGSASPKFFVEFGATDGITLSNTWLLEKKLGWNGILAEPARIWHDSLAENRSCTIDTRCVAKATGLKYNFLEVKRGERASPELSSIEAFANNGDWLSKIRLKNASRYQVETISLSDLLDAHNAPEEIQFLSIDTEGSELEILENYDFKSRKIKSICVEHNHQNKPRSSIRAWLCSHGYKQVFGRISKWDDWYVLGC
jgi:FkbM family methyltransferase